MKIVINRSKGGEVVEEPIDLTRFISVEIDFGNGQTFEILPNEKALTVRLVGKNFTLHAEPPAGNATLTMPGEIVLHSTE
jgi:hypothetical protein